MKKFNMRNLITFILFKITKKRNNRFNLYLTD